MGAKAEPLTPSPVCLPQASRSGAAFVHGFFGRQGGVSQGDWASLNIGEALGDTEENLAENRRRILAGLGLAAETRWCQLRQVHGTEVVVAGRASAPTAADGLLTDQKGVALCLYTADCVPLLMASHDGAVVGAAHAGWRGTVSKIAEALITAAMRHYGTAPQTISVMLGPAIGPCCFAVGEEVVAAIEQAFAPKIASTSIVRRAEGTFVDLWRLNHAVLCAAGVAPAAIGIERRCTACAPDTFFSYRRASGACGRQASVIARCPSL